MKIMRSGKISDGFAEALKKIASDNDLPLHMEDPRPPYHAPGTYVDPSMPPREEVEEYFKRKSARDSSASSSVTSEYELKDYPLHPDHWPDPPEASVYETQTHYPSWASKGDKSLNEEDLKIYTSLLLYRYNPQTKEWENMGIVRENVGEEEHYM